MVDAASEALLPLTPPHVARLVEHYRKFLAFLQRRTGDRAVAEEILQSAFARAVERGVPAADDAGAVTWFYAVLHNALTDHYRRGARERKALDSLGRDAAGRPADPELHEEICACFRTLLPTLKPEYAQLLERVDLERRPVSQVAAELNITPNNASVRLSRARAALRKQLERSCGVCATHGCLNCSCAG